MAAATAAWTLPGLLPGGYPGVASVEAEGTLDIEASYSPIVVLTATSQTVVDLEATHTATTHLVARLDG